MKVDYTKPVTEAVAKALEVLVAPEFAIGQWIVVEAEDTEAFQPLEMNSSFQDGPRRR